VEDDTPRVAEAIRKLVVQGVPPVHRSSQVKLYRNRIENLDTSVQWDPKEFRSLWLKGDAKEKTI
jgi:hypothetical protein